MKADIIKTLEKRAEHFDSMHHIYESREIWSTIDVIERLMPPELFSIPVVSKSVVSGSYYWVKLMTDDKHEPAMAIDLLGVMNFEFFNGVSVPCKQVNDYSECNYR